MTDELYMQRALDLAANGLGKVAPNPMVGCVIVHNDNIIGEGWHQKYGEAHAEVNAVAAVKDLSLLKEATVYVSLEPCSHYGKTPPCADLLIKHQVKRVVICNTDPHPKVNGEGIKKLQDAGIHVDPHVLADKGEKLNRRFFTSIRQNRPYIILKWAETADGFIGHKNGEPAKISNINSQMYSHQMRSHESAIMVGAQTVINDNPELNVRLWHGENPVRVIFDPNTLLNKDFKVFNLPGKTLYYSKVENKKIGNAESILIPSKNPLAFILQDLKQKGVLSLIVEGGARLHQLFINQNLYDQISVFKSTQSLGEGLPAAAVPAGIKLDSQLHLYDDELRTFLRNIPTI